MNCTNCGAENADVYCPRCGEKQPDHHDLKVSHFAHDAAHELVHLDSKLFTTLRRVVDRPGFLTQEYFAGRKKRYIAPLRLFLTLFAVQFLAYTAYKPVRLYSIETFAKFDKNNVVTPWLARKGAKYKMTAEQYAERVDSRFQKNLSLLQLLSIVGIAIVLKLIYRRRYFVEHLVFSAHYLSFAYLFSLLLFPVYWWLGVHPGPQQQALTAITILISLVYLFFAQRRFYEERPGKAAVKTAVLWLGSYVTQVIIMGGSLVAAMIQYR